MITDMSEKIPTNCHCKLTACICKTASVSNSRLIDGLCNVRFKIGVEIDWITPAETTKEMMDREQHERKIKKEAFELSNRMTEKLLKSVA